jgi:hypothetical protein
VNDWVGSNEINKMASESAWLQKLLCYDIIAWHVIVLERTFCCLPHFVIATFFIYFIQFIKLAFPCTSQSRQLNDMNYEIRNRFETGALCDAV